MRIVLIAFVLFSCAPDLFAWGPRGHRIVAEIAQQQLNSSARREIARMLDGSDLVSISTWADEIRSERPETAKWHFVDIPLQSEGFSDRRDCPSFSNDRIGDCVVDRIVFFNGVLANRNAPLQARAEALKFLVHLVGDIHQPMHAAKDAEGGNHIHIIEFGREQCGNRPCNLHLLWDVDLLRQVHLSERGELARIDTRIRREQLQLKSGGSPQSWADESFHLAQQLWLRDGAPADQAYFGRNLPVAETRLALAGLRLARLLNQALTF